ncbi:MAG: anthranilate synthase/aminodeoxychorismate synthase-like glutamine amidotransferase [Limisphaerales bacterium]
MILLIDNYDSFAYNLLDYFRQLDQEVIVKQHDRITLDEIEEMAPDGIVLSPGPRTPADAGIMMELIAHFHSTIPILGICLGHQAIGAFFGAKLVKGSAPVHGKTALVRHQGDAIFKELPNPLQVMRYHSLVLSALENTPLEIIGQTPEKVIMAIKHRTLPILGVQFHPESILTPQGLEMLSNWLPQLIVQKEDGIAS